MAAGRWDDMWALLRGKGASVETLREVVPAHLREVDNLIDSADIYFRILDASPLTDQERQEYAARLGLFPQSTPTSDALKKEALRQMRGALATCKASADDPRPA